MDAGNAVGSLDEPTFWCLGQPLVGRRPLEPDEHSVLGKRHARETRRLRQGWWARRMALGLLCIAVVVLSIFDTTSVLSRVGVFFIWAAIMFVVSGIIGAMLEVLFGPHVVVRWVFGLLLLLFAILALGPSWSASPTATNVLGTVVAGTLWFGGLCASLLREHEFRSLWPQMIAVGRDLARGEALVFRGLDADSGEDRSITLLPESHVVVAFNRTPCSSWTTAEPTSAAPRPEDVAEDPVDDSTEWRDLPIEEVVLSRRSLSSAELGDLQRETRYSLRKDIGQAFVFAWIAGMLVGALGRFGLDRHGGLDVVGLAAFGIVVAFLLTNAVRARRRLERDIRAGQVLAVRPQAPVACGPQVLEMLPESRIVWTVDGMPAPWRRTG